MKEPHAKKIFGQNFLIHSETIDHIITQAKTNHTKTVVEVGPGKGVVTRALLDADFSVIAIEKDPRMVTYLQEEFAMEIKTKQLQIHENDILEYDLDEIENVSFQIVANLPYYITGIFIRSMLERQHKPTAMTLLLQKEVVDRIIVANGKQSILSLSVALYGQAEKLCTVNRIYFDPVPNVDSAVIAITNISNNLLSENGVSSEQLFQIIKTAFASKRKTLYNNLKDILNERKIDFRGIANELGIAEKARPENLDIYHYLELTRLLGETSEKCGN